MSELLVTMRAYGARTDYAILSLVPTSNELHRSATVSALQILCEWFTELCAWMTLATYGRGVAIVHDRVDTEPGVLYKPVYSVPYTSSVTDLAQAITFAHSFALAARKLVVVFIACASDVSKLHAPAVLAALDQTAQAPMFVVLLGVGSNPFECLRSVNQPNVGVVPNCQQSTGLVHAALAKLPDWYRHVCNKRMITAMPFGHAIEKAA